MRRQKVDPQIQQDHIDRWAAWKTQLVTEAAREKNALQEQLVECQKAYEDLKNAAAKSKDEADLARIELELANNMVESLESSWADNRELLVKNAELKKKCGSVAPCIRGVS